MRMIGAVVIFLTSAWIGLSARSQMRRMTGQLAALSRALERMKCELQYALTPLPKLCKTLSQPEDGPVSDFFRAIYAQATGPEFHPEGCTRLAAAQAGLKLPEGTFLSLERLMDSFGQYDLPQQTHLVSMTLQQAENDQTELQAQLATRGKCYAALGLCTGAALAILVI